MLKVKVKSLWTLSHCSGVFNVDLEQLNNIVKISIFTCLPFKIQQ